MMSFSYCPATLKAAPAHWCLCQLNVQHSDDHPHQCLCGTQWTGDVE